MLSAIFKATVLVGALSSAPSSAQTLRQAFASMPDSLMPTLTKNNRLDMMDFVDAKMKAVVTNKLGGESLMTCLTSDSLCVRLSDALTVEMKADSVPANTVSVKRVYTTGSGGRQTVLTHYDARSWKTLEPATIVESTISRTDEKAKSQPQ